MILDALRRKTDRGGRGGASTPRPDSVLATLGYPTQRGRGGWSRTVLTFGVVAILLGFIAVAVPVYLLSPRSQDQQASTLSDAFQPEGVPPAQGTTPVPVPSASDVTRQPATEEPAPTAPRTAPAAATTQASAQVESAVPAVPVPTPLQRAANRVTVPETPARGTAGLAPAAAQPRTVQGREDRLPPPSEPRVADLPRTDPPPDHFGLALYYHRAGDFMNALTQYRLALERNDASAEVHNNLGLLYQDGGDTESAMEHFRRAIEIDPRHVSAQNNLGVAYLRDGRLEDASVQFTIALGVDDRNVESLVNLGLVHQAGGRAVEAQALLQRAVDIAPRHPGSHYNLAVVADEEGDVATAVTHYRAFLRFGTVAHPDLVPLVRSRLSEIGSQ